MLELGKAAEREHYTAGKLVKQLRFDALYSYGKLSYETFKGAKGLVNNYYFEDKASITEMLKKSLKKGDMILVKGSRGMKMEEIADSLI